MAKNNSQPGEGPEDVKAGEGAEEKAGAEAEAKAAEEAAKARAESEVKAKAEAEVKKESVRLRHKTGYEKYRCAGLVLTRKAETYLVTADQFVKLQSDPWVEIERE
ncbi:MAG: hypothetical protein LBU19_04960, partial [Treponema sp.]|nr:hypothetical protein [Treponema sp.]